MIPYTRFKLLVEEIAQELKDEIPSHFFGNYKFEKNAVIALQTMTDRTCSYHVLRNDVHSEMNFLSERQKLAIHAKRQTIQRKDMQCLHDIWKTIDPESPLGK